MAQTFGGVPAGHLWSSGKLVGVRDPGRISSHQTGRTLLRQGFEAASGFRLGWWLAGLGIFGLAVAAVFHPLQAGSAAAQDWSPFVLVAGLLLIGVVADDDGLFAAPGHQLARRARHGPTLFMGVALTVGMVTAVLNLDTSVAFVTPVLVYTAKSRGEGEAPLLYGALLLSNAGSLFLPGSNLTNLIVLGKPASQRRAVLRPHVRTGAGCSDSDRGSGRNFRAPFPASESREDNPS